MSAEDIQGDNDPALGGNPLRSFWMGGFECADHINAFGIRVNLLRDTLHLENLREDYERLLSLGISTAREGICWSQVEQKPYTYCWDTVLKMIVCAKETGVQLVWDLCHFGFPDDLTPLHPMFARRFAAMCRSFVLFYRSVDPRGTLIVTPINEVNFLSWLGGEVRGTSPYCINMGWEVKYALMRAYIEGAAAMKEIDPGIKILSTEPLVNIVPAAGADEYEIAAALQADEEQFQSLDMLTGRICPELGGKPEYLDIIGCNFYYSNQWEWNTNLTLPWANLEYDPRWLPLQQIFKKVFYRYDKPCILAETSHPGEHRPQWLTYIAQECAALINDGFPLVGICIYPVVDRPDWDDLSLWHRSGIWDRDIAEEGEINHRVPFEDYIRAITAAQHMTTNLEVFASSGNLQSYL